MDILYIGNDSPHSTSYHRAMALKRLGHKVQIINPEVVLPAGLSGKVHYRAGYRFIQSRVFNFLKENTESRSFELIWVNSGELLGSKCLKLLKTFNVPVCLYNNDDPTGKRDGRRFDSLLKALPYYDLCAVRVEKKRRRAEEIRGKGHCEDIHVI